MGHGHGDHHQETFKIPNYDIYKVEDCPDLKKLQETLAKKGLKDPWLRNSVHRFNPKYGTKTQRWISLLTRGWKLGIPAFLITIGIEQALGISYHPHHEENGHEGGHH